jgi:hypothetical protein
MADSIKNFVKVDVSAGYDASATTVVLATGHGARLPNPATANFNLVWWNATDYANPADDPTVEIIRVTGLSTDTLTVVRPAVGNAYNGETSANTAQTHNTGGKTYKMILSPTYKIFNDLNTDISGKLSTALSSANIFVGNGSNVATGVALTGDASISNAGVIAVNKTRLNVRNETGTTIASTKAVYIYRCNYCTN